MFIIKTTISIKENATNSSHPICVVTMLSLIPFASSNYSMEDNANITSRMQHPFGNLRSKFRISYSKLRRNTN